MRLDWPRALIFDVDETLAETEEAHRLSFNQAFAEANLDWNWSQDVYRKLLNVTGGKERIAHYIADWISLPLPQDADALIRKLHTRKTELYAARVAGGGITLRPGIAELIAEARRRDVTLAIASTTSRANVDVLINACLGAHSVEWFRAIVCGDIASAKKPAPDVYFTTLSALALAPRQVLAIEDSSNGVRSARAAGLPVVATPSLYSAGEFLAERRRSLRCTRHRATNRLVLIGLAEPTMKMAGFA
jgi:HAD superfamily hydrolase (TIGR01509 family)